MDHDKRHEQLNRRAFFKTTAGAVGAMTAVDLTALGITPPAPQLDGARNAEPRAISRVVTPTLDIAYEVSGPVDGPPVILLHGWPDDVRTWDKVLPTLHASGFRTIAPYLRGFGPTRFRSPETPRSGQLSALGRDLIDLADGLGLSTFRVIGHDWGARAAYIAAALWPERVNRCVSISVGWGTNDPTQPLSLQQAQNYWYHWYMALDRGERLVREDRVGFTRYLWDTWSPHGWYTEQDFRTTALSFENPDWATVVLHSYRQRWGLAEGVSSYAALEARLQPSPTITVPTLVIHGGVDTCNSPQTSEGREHLFSAPYHRIVIDRAGHFPQREAPASVARAIVPFLTG